MNPQCQIRPASVQLARMQAVLLMPFPCVQVESLVAARQDVLLPLLFLAGLGKAVAVT